MNGYDICMDNYYAFALAILADVSVDKALEKIGIGIPYACQWKVKQERNDALISDKQSGISIMELAEKYNISYGRVVAILNDHGIYKRRKHTRL